VSSNFTGRSLGSSTTAGSLGTTTLIGSSITLHGVTLSLAGCWGGRGRKGRRGSERTPLPPRYGRGCCAVFLTNRHSPHLPLGRRYQTFHVVLVWTPFVCPACPDAGRNAFAGRGAFIPVGQHRDSDRAPVLRKGTLSRYRSFAGLSAWPKVQEMYRPTDSTNRVWLALRPGYPAHRAGGFGRDGLGCLHKS